MRAVAQRVSKCSVKVGKRICGSIDRGLLVYLAVEQDDTRKDLDYLVDKIVFLRIFPDSEDKMNLSLKDVGAKIMVVSQFTLLGDVRRGRRPSYAHAARPEKAMEYYQLFMERLSSYDIHVESGEFRAKMAVSSTNDGPVTIIIDSHKLF